MFEGILLGTLFGVGAFLPFLGLMKSRWVYARFRLGMSMFVWMPTLGFTASTVESEIESIVAWVWFTIFGVGLLFHSKSASKAEPQDFVAAKGMGYSRAGRTKLAGLIGLGISMMLGVSILVQFL